MSILVLLVAATALTFSMVAAYRNWDWRDFTKYEKLVGIYVILITGWPLTMTFFIGPLLWATPESAGILSPTLWYLPAFVFSAAYFVHGLFREGSRFDIPALLQYTTLFISLVFIATGGVIRNSDIAKLVIPMTLLLVTLVKPADIRGSVVVGWGCRTSLVIILASVCAGILLNPKRLVEPCRLDKCNFIGDTLTSPFAGNGNILGLAAAIMVPFAIASIDIVGALSVLAAVGLTAELAGGRTAELGILAAGLLVLLIWLMPNQRRPILIIGLATTMAFSLVPAIYPFGGTEYTFRGFLWTEARDVISGHVMLGSGPTTWFTMAQTSIRNLNYSAHNGWLDITLSIGLTGLLVLVVAVVLKYRLSGESEKDVLLFYFSTLFAISALESIYVPYILAILPFVSILPFIGGPGRAVGIVVPHAKSNEVVAFNSDLSGKG